MDEGAPFVSTGALPRADDVEALVVEAHQRYRNNDEGENSRVYPALGRAPRELFGVCVVGVNGRRHAAGDADVEFSLMSVSKPFVFALICDALGADVVRDRVGVNATGRSFNSVAAVEQAGGGRTNPMVNSGAIATSSLAPGGSGDEQWEFLLDGLSRFAGRRLELHDEVFESASATNHRNRSIAQLLESYDGLGCDPAQALEVYTKQSSLRVSATDLAVMGATLADGGVNPLTGVRVVDAESCRCALAVMAVAGLYETSGDWLYDVGLPGKSGIGGGIVTISPGKGGLGTFSPPLDPAGNSVRGRLAARFLSRRLGLDIFASEPAG